MPAKGSQLKCGHRNYIFGKKFYDTLTQKYNVVLTRKQCSDVIRDANKIIADLIRDELDGFKLPNGIGYLTVTKFKPKKDPIDWQKTKELGKYVYHLNFHSFGYCPRVCWYRVGRIRQTSLSDVYKFESWTTLGKEVSNAFKNGKQYMHWDTSDFIEKGRLENLYSKKYRPETLDKINNDELHA